MNEPVSWLTLALASFTTAAVVTLGVLFGLHVFPLNGRTVVMFLALAATATTTVVIALGLIRRLLSPDHRLLYLPTPADH